MRYEGGCKLLQVRQEVRANLAAHANPESVSAAHDEHQNGHSRNATVTDMPLPPCTVQCGCHRGVDEAQVQEGNAQLLQAQSDGLRLAKEYLQYLLFAGHRRFGLSRTLPNLELFALPV